MRHALSSTAALVLSAALATSASAALINGSFEPATPFGPYAELPGGSGDIPGWVTTDTGAEWAQPAAFGVGSAPDGLYIVDLANYIYSAGGVQQTFATIPGTTYSITFSFGTSTYDGRWGTGSIIVSADGQSQTFDTTNGGIVILWELGVFTFVADDATATVSFRCLQDAFYHYAQLDAVSLTANPTSVEIVASKMGQTTAFGIPSIGQSPFHRSIEFVVGTPVASIVEASVLDTRGRLVSTLAPKATAPGYVTFRWDGRGQAGYSLASGVYYLRASNGHAAATRRVVKLD